MRVPASGFKLQASSDRGRAVRAFLFGLRLRIFLFPLLLLFLLGCWWLLYTDNIPPTVTMLKPANGGLVVGNTTLEALAADTSGVRSVAFFVDQESVGAGVPDGSAYTCAWNAAGLADRSVHTIFAKATDSFNNVGYSDTVRVTAVKVYDIDVYHGETTIPGGYFLPVAFLADANDSLLGDARVTDSLLLSDFFWCDSVNYASFRAHQTFTTLSRQQNQSRISLAALVPATGRYYLVFSNAATSDRTVWFRFLRRKWGK